MGDTPAKAPILERISFALTVLVAVVLIALVVLLMQMLFAAGPDQVWSASDFVLAMLGFTVITLMILLIFLVFAAAAAWRLLQTDARAAGAVAADEACAQFLKSDATAQAVAALMDVRDAELARSREEAAFEAVTPETGDDIRQTVEQAIRQVGEGDDQEFSNKD